MVHRDHLFGGPVPDVYDAGMVPMLFEPYAADLAHRLRAHCCARVLELGAGTGVLTRALASTLPLHSVIVATDLNQAMLDRAAAVGVTREVEWRQADAAELPFPDGSFDAVACQFAVMFFPDKARAFADVRRVLAPEGIFVFNVWDRIAENEFAETVDAAVAELFPENPPRFMARTPHGYSPPAAVPTRRARPPWRSVRERRCARKSRRAMPAACTRQPRLPTPRWRGGSARVRSRAGCRRTSSRSSGDRAR
jgi:SAM-dependent methyltransferase